MSENNAVSEKSETTAMSVKDVIVGLVGNDQNVADAAYAAFVGFARKERGLVRNGVSARFEKAMSDGRFDDAKSLWSVVNRIKTVSPVKSEMTEESVKAVVAEKVALLRYAADALFAGSVPISGWDGESPILDETDIPEVTDEMVEKAMKFANVSIGTKTKENDIPALIGEYFATVPVGAFRKVSVIRHGIAQMHPNKTIDATWDGRLNAALFGTNGVEGLVSVASGETDERAVYDNASDNGKAGAFRVEDDETDNQD